MTLIILLIISVVVGAAVSGVTGLDFLFLPVAAFLFICLLPAAAILSLVHSEASYAQDRADYREAVAETAAEERAWEHEAAEDARIDRLITAVKRRKPSVKVDNRQVHIHGRDV